MKIAGHHYHGLLKGGMKLLDGRTPLSWATQWRRGAVVKLLLETGNVDTDLKDKDGRTPLLWAAQWGHEAIVKLLLETGKVDAESKDKDGRTLLS
ncbi:hypothetical protein OIDMADRAFT_51037 [Oidiodendron maius Zn]|uniref:Uncharacterized protein n=1 Tax=Oidiodendron maius (strain Zn) TaxID=913774 RepID=A0A0C3HQC5_OIDMZ|nr:hypothetical protein OIDMADRAFT_51037 [Oidiodendron maius Zn]